MFVVNNDQNIENHYTQPNTSRKRLKRLVGKYFRMHRIGHVVVGDEQLSTSYENVRK